MITAFTVYLLAGIVCAEILVAVYRNPYFADMTVPPYRVYMGGILLWPFWLFFWPSVWWDAASLNARFYVGIAVITLVGAFASVAVPMLVVLAFAGGSP